MLDAKRDSGGGLLSSRLEVCSTEGCYLKGSERWRCQIALRVALHAARGKQDYPDSFTQHIHDAASGN